MADVSKATQMNNGLAIQVYNEQSCLLMEKRMRTAYQSAIDELQKELDDFYEKYATNNKIDLQVAKQKLSLSDSENVKDLAEQYKKLLSKKNIGVRTQKKLDEIAAKTKVSRLEQLLVNCTKQAAEVGIKAKDEMVDVGSLMYKDGFGHTMFNIQKTVGMGVNFNMPSARVIKTASNVEWLGATFTDRTGYTLDRLTNNIEQIIPQLFIQGKNADEFGKVIAKQFNMSENAAKRDMRTLTTLITNQASILAYNNCEMVEEFEFVATLDGRTSDKCRAMDGKRFKLNEAAPFINQPPLHYNCRSTTIPYFEDLDEYNPSERIARDEQGKTYMVPANMSYREWCTKHAQGLYANSDKTDWNYEPEKVLAYERIVDERRKLKALQEDRVVYQDSDFVINHDISDYSEEEIEHLMQLFNVKQNSKEKLQQKINETMTKINNIRKELNSDKTANILPAKDYNDIIGNLHKYYEMLNDEYDILNEKSSYQKYVKVMGLNDKPETMSKQDFQAYIAENKDLPVLYRAVTDAGPTGMVGGVTRGKYLRRGILNDLMYGSQQYIGDGVYGDGLYFSTQPTHGSYGSFSGSKETAIDRKYMIQATFKSGTKKILWDDLQKLMGEYRDKGYNVGDPSSFARSLGYQVIQCHRDGVDEIYYNILDRSALVVQDVDKESVELSPEEQKRRIILADKASIRDRFTKAGMLNVMNMQFATRQQNPNLFSYNEIVAFDAAVNNEELAALINFTFKNELYTDELQEHLKIKDFYDEYDDVADKFTKLASDDEIEIDYFGKKVKIKKYDIYNEIIDVFEGGDGSEYSVRGQCVSATYKAIAFIREKLNEGLSTDDLVKLNSQLTINEMANRLSNALDVLVDSAYNNIEDYIDISAKKELNIKEIKQKIGDNIKQKNPINDDQIILNMKRSVVNRSSAYDIQNFVADKIILDDDVFGDLGVLINFEKYTKDILDIDVYEDAFNKAYDDLYDKMNSLLDTDVPHDFVIFKKDDGTEIRTELIFSDLEDWLYDMERNRNGSVEDKSFALEKIRFALRNDYFEHIINRTINDGDAEGTDLNDVDAAVKNYIDKFTKQTQNIVEDEIKRKQGGNKVDIKEIEKEVEKENKEVLNSIYEMYASPIGMANEMRYNKTFTFKKRDDNRDMFLIDLYTKQTLVNDKIFKKILALDETEEMFSMNSEMRSGDVVYDIDEYYSNVYEEIVKMLEDCAEQSDTFDVEINVLNKKKMLPIAIDKTLKTFKDNDTDIQSKRDTVQKFIDKMQQVVNDEYYSEIEKNYDNLKIDNAIEISKNNLDIIRNEMQTFLNYRLRNAQQQIIDTIHTLTSEEIKALERKDAYDFKELQRKALKEFKYYKGTMKKAEIQNESLRKDERISKNNEKYFQQTMRDIFEKNDFCMRLNKNVLPLIAKSKFMNQFETGNAPLGLTFGQRRAVAKKMFTIPEDAEGSEYEKYGFLGSKNPKDDFKDDENFTGDYGDTIVRFKKRNLMHRTTFTIGDSLFNCINDNVRSSPVINPQIASIQRGHVNEVIYGLNVVENADAEKSYLDIQALTRQKYVELQYHGNLTIDDVESVTFNKKTTNVNNSEVRKIIAMLKERGIKCYLVDSKKEVIQEI